MAAAQRVPTIEEKCRLAEVSRAGYYRYLQEKAPVEEDLVLRNRLQQLVAETRQRRGYRPIMHALRQEGFRVNHKRLLRLMREDNLLCLRKKKYVLTTDSNHEFHVYTNLARGLRVTGLNQLWVADITFIRLKTEFVYLAVVLDFHSRRVIGWELGRSLETTLPLAALRQALRERRWVRGQLVHHSDRGVQYASRAYTELLEQNGIAISMSRAGNPYDNARAERFMRTVKQEEVYATKYQDLEDARVQIGTFLEEVYELAEKCSAGRKRPILADWAFNRINELRLRNGVVWHRFRPKVGFFSKFLQSATLALRPWLLAACYFRGGAVDQGTTSSAEPCRCIGYHRGGGRGNRRI